MRSVKASLKLYSGPGKRRQPIHSGYRPGFWAISESGENGMEGLGQTSGRIEIPGAGTMSPGEEKLVTITFVTVEILGEAFGVDCTVYFAEGPHILGEARILEIL